MNILFFWKQVDGGERLPFNDSGCLLDDKDLFDNGLDKENDQPLEDEESLESIRAAVKNKIKQRKVPVDCDTKLL